jgi:hypothetical protein
MLAIAAYRVFGRRRHADVHDARCGAGSDVSNPFGVPPLMSLLAEHQFEHIGETSGCRDHDHDLVHELSSRLDRLWRYDQYIANAEWRDELRSFWEDCKVTEKEAVCRLRHLIQQEVQNGCF